MKRFLIIFSLLGFFVIGVLGPSVIFHDNDSGHGRGCIFVAAQGMDCSKEKDAIVLLNFHLNVLKGFSQAVFSQDNILQGFLLLGLIFGLWAILQKKLIFLFLSIKRSLQGGGYAQDCTSVRRQLAAWLALHEHSPSTRHI